MAARQHVRADLDRAAEKIDQTARSIAGSRARLESDVGALQAVWAGDAARAFGRVWARWLADFATIQHALSSMQERTVDTRARYGATEERQHATLNRVEALLGS